MKKGRGFSGIFFRKGGKDFALLAGKVKILTDPVDREKIPVRLKESVAKPNIFLSSYAKKNLTIHGIESGTSLDKIGRDAIVAFGYADEKSPSMAAKLACFTNANLIIMAIQETASVGSMDTVMA